MSALEQLRALPREEVTLELIHAAVAERGEQMVPHGGIAMAPDQFWSEDALSAYEEASKWWPHDAPDSHALPTLRELCVYAAGPPGSPLRTAVEVLTLLANRAAQWAELQGRDPARPNESAADRQRRRAREGMARSRAQRRAAGVDPAIARVGALHAAYIEACRARKAAAAEHDHLVDAARAEWESAKAALKTGGSDEPPALPD